MLTSEYANFLGVVPLPILGERVTLGAAGLLGVVVAVVVVVLFDGVALAAGCFWG